jgi:hypothetical protein
MAGGFTVWLTGMSGAGNATDAESDRSRLSVPHGGHLIERTVQGEEAAALRRREVARILIEAMQDANGAQDHG